MTMPRNFRIMASPVQRLAQVGFKQRFQGLCFSLQGEPILAPQTLPDLFKSANRCLHHFLCRGQTCPPSLSAVLLDSQRHVALQVASNGCQVHREETGEMQTLRRVLKASEDALNHLTERHHLRAQGRLLRLQTMRQSPQGYEVLSPPLDHR